ncbi:MAG TPA: DUF4286 family protein [Amphiplicatus sp.]|nr:DUF4286 family protein [Caulobacterales bacterium]HOP20004.1 DUF4286 family protein [Amphiplicatus sp.]HRX39298.1 DUF4286 family protein [Parvularculaceae bacterium]
MADHEILYEVVVTIAPEARAAYLDWLKPHVEEILTFDGFLEANIYQDPDAPNEITSSYRLRDRAAIEAYLAGPAARMRADGLKRFGEKMSARRRILNRVAR